MPKAKSRKLRLAVDNMPRSPERAHAPPDDIGRKLSRHHDAGEAMRIIEEQAGLEFDVQKRGGIQTLQLESAELDARYEVSSETLNELEKQKAGTKRYMKSSHLYAGSDNRAVEFKDWLVKDKFLILLIGVCLVSALGMGAGNIYANLMSSGNPIFIEDPWLAAMLSALLPIASVAVKFVTNFMSLDKSRKRYAITIYALTLTTLAIWSVLFAMNFSGVSGGIDWEALESAGNSGPALVWSQMLLEMLAGAALFLAAEDIYMRYAPDVYVENLEYLEIEKALKTHLPQHEALCARRAEIQGRLNALLAERQAFINHKLADYVSLRARLDAASDIL